MNENSLREEFVENGIRHVIQYNRMYNGEHMRVCQECKIEKSIEKDFGFRTMKDGTIRNQSQCTKCRGKY